MGGTDTDSILYLDCNATAPIRPEALTAVTHALATETHVRVEPSLPDNIAKTVEYPSSFAAILRASCPGFPALTKAR
jgi:hypothetical protein